MSDRILVMSDRPGRIVEEINVGLPDRDNPMARVANPRAGEIVAHLFHSLAHRQPGRRLKHAVVLISRANLDPALSIADCDQIQPAFQFSQRRD